MFQEKAALVEESIQEIESASSAQAAAIEQINQGLSQVSAVIQTNAATAEESSAASELAAQAQVLQQEIMQFKLAGEKESLRMSESGMTYSESQNRQAYNSKSSINALAKY